MSGGNGSRRCSGGRLYPFPCRAEERIAAFLRNNPPNELTACEAELIDKVLDNAADFLHNPDFILTDAQRIAIKSAFEHKISIITGPPGVGKTAVIALINAIATMLYSDSGTEQPALVIALAGRAASNAREAGTCWHGKYALPLPASTIRRSLGVRSEGDDGPDAFEGGKRINCDTLIIEEASMNSTPLLDAIFKRSKARHYVFVGDENQLPPIGQGKPFRDMIAAETIPTTRLTKNWRTDCQGIRDLCADMLAENADTLSSRLSQYESDGSVRFEACERNERATRAANVYAELIDKGVTPDEIAILGPHNQGDEAGVRAANNAVRSARRFRPDRIMIGEQLIVLKNDYKARATNQELVENESGEGKEKAETIYNGERCYVAKCGADYLDLEFPENSEGIARSVRLLMQNPDGRDAQAQLPEDIAFGYALSVHKAQGSQFRFVIMLAERGYKGAGVVQGSNVYTGISRAREQVIIVGQPDDFTQAASTDEIPRETLLKDLLKGKR
jgi:exodeoxyribonuclease V alpha subunit